MEGGLVRSQGMVPRCQESVEPGVLGRTPVRRIQFRRQAVEATRVDDGLSSQADGLHVRGGERAAAAREPAANRVWNAPARFPVPAGRPHG